MNIHQKVHNMYYAIDAIARKYNVDLIVGKAWVIDRDEGEAISWELKSIRGKSDEDHQPE